MSIYQRNEASCDEDWAVHRRGIGVDFRLINKVLARLASRQSLRALAGELFNGMTNLTRGGEDVGRLLVGEADKGTMCAPPDLPAVTVFDCTKKSFDCATWPGMEQPFKCDDNRFGDCEGSDKLGYGCHSDDNKFQCESGDPKGQVYDCMTFFCGTSGNPEDYDCRTDLDFACGQTFNCWDTFDCSGGHIFWCRTNFQCVVSFTCQAGTKGGITECDDETYKYTQDNGFAGDFNCGTADEGADNFTCVKVFKCHSLDQFGCEKTTKFDCQDEVDCSTTNLGSDGFECREPDVGCIDDFTCEGPPYTCTTGYVCESGYTCGEPYIEE